MKFDFSTILLLVVAVIPGFFAQKTRDRIAPKSFAQQGTTTELAELVSLGIATQALIAFVGAIPLVLLGWLVAGSPFLYFAQLDALFFGEWISVRPVESVLFLLGYAVLSFFVSCWLGFFYGLARLEDPVAADQLGKAAWTQRYIRFVRKLFGGGGVLVERPFLYTVLSPATEAEAAKTVFVELEMKNGMGFYSGQLSLFALGRDEEPHKPIYLTQAWFKREPNDEYRRVDADGVVIDLAEAATMLVKKVDLRGKLIEMLEKMGNEHRQDGIDPEPFV